MKSSEYGSKNNKGIRIYEERMKKILFDAINTSVINFKFVCVGGVFLIHSFFSYVLLELPSLLHCKSKQARIGINIRRL